MPERAVNVHVVLIRSVDDSPAGMVTAESTIGTTRILTMLSGEQLLRIC